jgi:hypothetical protein
MESTAECTRHNYSATPPFYDSLILKLSNQGSVLYSGFHEIR